MIEPKTQREKDCYTKGYRDAEKAYGACHFCYGKGYSTVIKKSASVGMSTADVKMLMKPCECERGKQLERIWPQV